jgi:hypothetical protein
MTDERMPLRQLNRMERLLIRFGRCLIQRA